MIQVAICDDIPEEIEKLKVHINRYANENQMQISVSAFSKAEEIIAALDEAESYDIIFLDIYMESLNGLDLARHIRKNGAKCRIVFFSTSTEHALAAFGVNAIQYLVKPVEYDAFTNAMKLAMIDKAHSEEAISVQFGNEIVKVPYEKILYVEAQRNYQHIYLIDGSCQKSRMTNHELFDYVRGRSEFIRVGASYIVNLEHVIRVTSKDIELIDGRKIVVPRREYATLKALYLDYFSPQGGSHANT